MNHDFKDRVTVRVHAMDSRLPNHLLMPQRDYDVRSPPASPKTLLVR